MRNTFFLIIAAAALLLPIAALAQSSSINSFSPYTFWGLGDVHTQGSAYLRAMGGAGVALRTPARTNPLNPAALSGGMRNSFIIHMGLEGQNYYLKNDAGQKSSYNSFNLRDFSLQFPLAGFIGFGVSLTPFSSVGYRVEQAETNPDITAELGKVNYLYEGSGGVNQIKAGVGVRLHRRLSLGAELVYYHGNIERTFSALFIPITSPNLPADIFASTTERVAKAYANFGLQFSPILSSRQVLTLAATWQPGGKLGARIKRLVPSGSFMGDTVSYSSQLSELEMPDVLRLGAAYQSMRWNIAADYLHQNWGRNATSGQVAYRSTSTWMVGAEYTPNRLDIRNFANRLTYRLGMRYGDYYLSYSGREMSEKAITFGVGFPLHAAALSNLNVGFELGTRGSTSRGMIKENFFKISLGFSLFGEDDWFVKRKYY